jgi:hypothetical protein
MYFEIIGEITGVETFATVAEFARFRGCEGCMDAKHQQVRVIDESGEDYLYPQSFFAPIDLPPPIRKAVLSAV